MPTAIPTTLRFASQIELGFQHPYASTAARMPQRVRLTRAQFLTARSRRRSDRSGVSNGGGNLGGQHGMVSARPRKARRKRERDCGGFAFAKPSLDHYCGNGACLLGLQPVGELAEASRPERLCHGVVTYERDSTADESIHPPGGFEVFAVPITIANSGARDAAVLALQLDVSNPKTGLSARLEGTYTADGAYFANTGARRPKTPFSALVIAGRSAWTGTVLFYPMSYSNGKSLTPARKVATLNFELSKKYASEMSGSSSISVLREKRPDLPEFVDYDAYYAKVLNQNDEVEVTLKVIRPPPSGWLDRALGTQVQPVTLALDMPDIPGDRVSRGELVRLRRATAGL
jgi:hypothetical protein